jgi:hypothetical protein
MRRTIEHWTLEKEMSAGLTREDKSDTISYVRFIKFIRPFRRGISWLVWVSLSVCFFVFGFLTFYPDKITGIKISLAYCIAIFSYSITRSFLEYWEYRSLN